MKRERGAALLTAMLTVTLVATFAAAALWQQWRSVEVEAAERARVQASWILTGALDWGRLILSEDARSRNGNVDHLGEPWAVPLQEARLSTFLAASSAGVGDAGADADEVFLSGQIIDQQSLLNVGNMVDRGVIKPAEVQVFQRLFDLLGLPPGDLTTLAENLRFAEDISTDNRSATQASVMPQRPDQLVWLGVSPETVSALAPYVTLLPGQTLINVNTASAQVIYAAIAGISMAEAQDLVARRASAPFRSTREVTQLLPTPPPPPAAPGSPAPQSPPGQANFGVASNYFEIRSRLRIDKMVVEERALVNRAGSTVRALQRQRTVLDPAALAQLNSGR